MYHTIYLAPHLDDAAFSCGGQIAQTTAAGKEILIVTIMAGSPPDGPLSPFAQRLHQRWQLDRTAVAARRTEDAAACHILGADYQHWSVPDCIYRRDPASGQALYTSGESLFGPVHLADHTLIDTLTTQLRNLPLAKRIAAPLAVGNHVDHQIVRQAAEAWAPDHLVYYEDYPYAQKSGAVEKVIDPADSWQPMTIPLTEADLHTKYRAIRAHHSQLSTFFEDPADLMQKVGGYAAAVGGERVWQLRLNHL